MKQPNLPWWFCLNELPEGKIKAIAIFWFLVALLASRNGRSLHFFPYIWLEEAGKRLNNENKKMPPKQEKDNQDKPVSFVKLESKRRFPEIKFFPVFFLAQGEESRTTYWYFYQRTTHQ